MQTQLGRQILPRLLLLLSLPAATAAGCPRSPRAQHVLDVGTDVRVELREETEATGKWSGNKARGPAAPSGAKRRQEAYTVMNGGRSSQLWIFLSILRNGEPSSYYPFPNNRRRLI